jgi:hydroxymethylbilane synthase
MGGCSTPISALATIKEGNVFFRGNILSLDGKEKEEITFTVAVEQAENIGTVAAQELLQKGGDRIIASMRNA